MLSTARSRMLYRRMEVVSIVIFALVSVLLVILSPRSAAPSEANAETVTALASCMPNQGWVPLKVYCSAFGSEASAGIAEYAWDLDANGLFDTASSAENGYTRYTYTKPGQYRITLQVTDAKGRTATDSVVIDARHPGASNVDYWNVFDDRGVRRVDIRITQENWRTMWSDPEAKLTVPVNATVFGEPLNNVGFRMRGQFSLRESGAKKPWKIDTDAFVPEQEFHNLRQLMFINNIGDPTMLQEKLAYDMLRFAGVPASHVSYVELWVDFVDDDASPIFWGVYTMIERVDRKFLANRFGQDSKGGNLYKASHAQRGPMDLIYYGPNIEDYPTQNGMVAYGKMTNEEEADYSDIINLCYVIDGVTYASPEAFAEALEAVFDVDTYLRYTAVMVTLANWDYYPYTGNNYYLFHDPVTDKFEWIPWDITWGGDARQPLFELEGPGLVERAPLYDRVFEVDRYRVQYAAYLDLLNRVWFNYDHVYRRSQALHTMIAPYVTQATGDKMYFGDDASFSIEEFNNGWMHLAEMARERNAFILSALEDEPWRLADTDTVQ